MEPRSFTRVLIRIDATLQTASGPEVHGVVRDLSLKGISIEGDSAASPGDECTISIFLATGSDPIPILLSGTVVRNDVGVVGATFSSVAPEDADHLEKLVLYNTPDALVFEEEVAAHSSERPTIRDS